MHRSKMETIAPRPMAPSSIMYYPDGADIHQHMALRRMQTLPSVPTVPSTPVYSRPSSSSSQQPMNPQIYHARLAAAVTPCVSPQPNRPAFMLETVFSDGEYFPTTPQLSSSASSPRCCDNMLQTPLNPMFSGLDGFEGEHRIKSEQLDVYYNDGDWTKCTSSPVTPRKFHHPSILRKYILRDAPTHILGRFVR